MYRLLRFSREARLSLSTDVVVFKKKQIASLERERCKSKSTRTKSTVWLKQLVYVQCTNERVIRLIGR
jgi:hypothetical protein